MEDKKLFLKYFIIKTHYEIPLPNFAISSWVARGLIEWRDDEAVCAFSQFWHTLSRCWCFSSLKFIKIELGFSNLSVILNVPPAILFFSPPSSPAPQLPSWRLPKCGTSFAFKMFSPAQFSLPAHNSRSELWPFIWHIAHCWPEWVKRLFVWIWLWCSTVVASYGHSIPFLLRLTIMPTYSHTTAISYFACRRLTVGRSLRFGRWLHSSIEKSAIRFKLNYLE